MMRTVTALALVLVCTISASALDRTLRFRKDGTFHILQFADLHYGEGETKDWGPEQDVNSTRVMRLVLPMEKPDLVVFSGDQITGNNIDKNATAYWSQLVQPCVEQNQRWVSIFGNHDDAPLEPALAAKRQITSRNLVSRREMQRFDMTYSLSLSQSGPDSLHGVSNYWLPVFPAEPRADETPLAILWFLDSGGGSYPQIVYQDQVDWYLNVSRTLEQRYKRRVPAIVYVHIPVWQYRDVVHKPECFGLSDDDISPTQTDTGLLAAFHSRGDVRAVLVGHDHGNDWCCPHKQSANSTAIWLCFGRHSGYGGYGDWDRGARAMELKLNGALDWTMRTYVRMENSSIIDAGNLPV